MLSESQYRTLEVLNTITSLISLMGILSVLALTISVGVFGYKKKKIEIFHTISFNKLSFYIIAFIFVSDTFRMIGHLLPTPSSPLPLFYSDLTCRPGAFFKLFGSISTFLWMNITSYIVYKLLLYPHKFDKFYVERIKRIFHCISWPIALLISITPLALQQYTMARTDGPWCFIDSYVCDIPILAQHICQNRLGIFSNLLFIKMYKYTQPIRIREWPSHFSVIICG